MDGDFVVGFDEVRVDFWRQGLWRFVVGVMTLGAVGPAAGGAVGMLELSFLVMDLCVAMREAFMTSSWSPSMGPILASQKVTSVLNLSHHPASSTVSGLNSTKAMSDVNPMCVSGNSQSHDPVVCLLLGDASRALCSSTGVLSSSIPMCGFVPENG